MKHVGQRANPADIVSQEQLSSLLDLAGTQQMTGPFDNRGQTETTFSGGILNLGGNGDYYIATLSAGQVITGLGTAREGARRLVRFYNGIVITHSDTLVLPGAANITTQTDDVAMFLSRGGGSWRTVFYTRADGTALKASVDTNVLDLPGTRRMSGAFKEAPAVYADSGTGSTLNLAAADANTVYANGTGTVTALGSGSQGQTKRVYFQQAMTLRHSVSLIDLPGQANIVTANGDWAEFYCAGNDSWICIDYQKRNGTALVASAGFTEAQVRNTPLTGLSTGTAGALAATDTVLVAMGKLQAQLNASAFRMETIATTSVGQTSYTVPNGYVAGQIQVWFNGALLAPADYTATNGTAVVLASGALSTSDVMQVGVLGALRAQDDALLQYTVASLPAASSNAFKLRWCTNMSGGAGVVVSNGTNWLRVADNTIVTV